MIVMTNAPSIQRRLVITFGANVFVIWNASMVFLFFVRDGQKAMAPIPIVSTSPVCQVRVDLHKGAVPEDDGFRWFCVPSLMVPLGGTASIGILSSEMTIYRIYSDLVHLTLNLGQESPDATTPAVGDENVV
jgi:hypothetical protein